jgi:hypothetical protein
MAVLVGTPDPLAKLDEFAARGFIARNINGDGTAPKPTRMLGAAENVNLAAVRNGKAILGANKLAPMIIRLDDQPQQKKYLDFSHAVDLARVTPAEAVIAINGAGFQNIQAIVDNSTGRCNVRCTDSSVQFVQIFGLLAGALGFGGGVAFRSLGCFFWDYVTKDDVITIARTEQRSDDTNVDQAGGGLGTLTRIIVQGKRTGVQYAINTKPRDKVWRQMVEGGELAIGIEGKPETYFPPAGGDNTGERGIELWAVYPLYTPNTQSSVSQERKMIVEHIFSGAVTAGDPARGAQTLTNFNYTFNAGSEYIDENGSTVAQPVEDEYDMNLWNTFKLIPSVTPTWQLAMLDTVKLTDFTLTQDMNLTTGQIAFNGVTKDPLNASGYTVSISTPTALTDTVLSWDDDNSRIRIECGSVTGTESVAVTFTNEDNTTVAHSFNLTVA